MDARKGRQRNTLHPCFHHEIMTHKSQPSNSSYAVRPLSGIPGGCLRAKHGSHKKKKKLNQKIFLYAKRVKSLGGEGPKLQ